MFRVLIRKCLFGCVFWLNSVCDNGLSRCVLSWLWMLWLLLDRLFR